MTGADYVALTRISNKANDTLAEIGETCERVPADALGWLLSSSKIEAAPQAAVLHVHATDMVMPIDLPPAADVPPATDDENEADA